MKEASKFSSACRPEPDPIRKSPPRPFTSDLDRLACQTVNDRQSNGIVRSIDSQKHPRLIVPKAGRSGSPFSRQLVPRTVDARTLEHEYSSIIDLKEYDVRRIARDQSGHWMAEQHSRVGRDCGEGIAD